MKVLIVDFDLFDSVGGGATIYQNLIKKNSHINFFYFSEKEKLDHKRPSNAFIIEDKYHFTRLSPNEYTWQLKNCYNIANKIANSVKGQSFNIVEIPDYRLMGVFIRPALKRFNVKYDKLVLAMHGNLSVTFEMDWHGSKHEVEELKTIEELQYENADIRYSISKRYVAEWDKKTRIKAEYVSPLYFIDIPPPKENRDFGGKPELVFFGRTERRKGPDIFIDLLWNLDKGLYKEASIIGPDCNCSKGISSTEILSNFAMNRAVNVNFFPKFSSDQKKGIFSSKTLTLLPSRYDTLNLLGIEALLSGSPVAIGSGAGITDFINEELKDIPYIPIEMKNVFSCLKQIKNVLSNYDQYRSNLIKKINELKLTTQYFPFEKIYQKPIKVNKYTIKRVENIYCNLQGSEQKNRNMIINILNLSINFKITRQAFQFVKKIKNEAQNYFFRKKRMLISLVRKNFLAKITYRVFESFKFRIQMKKTQKLLEENLSLLKTKLLKYFSLSFLYCRVSIWKEIARLERYLGHSLISVVYDLRIMRLLGNDKFNRLDLVILELEKHGFDKEAEVASAMFGKEINNSDVCLKLLNNAYKRNLRPVVNNDYIIFDDNRKKNQYRVSIIVSLYNAADKLALFLSSIENQTLFEKEEAELIFVETASPLNDYEVFQSFKKSSNIPMVYAKTSKRETIQSAWNRGISISRGEFLSFLGVDEMILPETSEVLAKELDNNPEIDWVQADSIVTEVDEDGTCKKDIMKYDREGYKQELVYLETCYLSWVGALYRKSIHERFGYYDSTFSAAGDSEFKNRILPHIRTKHIPRTLGIFFNYPDGQTTCSPIAEIEDLRAWYLHRTPAGLEYAFSKHDLEDLESLFMKSLNYRKSYTKHISTDIEYAFLLLTFIKEKFPKSRILKYEKRLKNHLVKLRALEESSWGYYKYILIVLFNKINPFKRKSYDHFFHLFNDNRFEQHCMIWKSDLQ